MLLCLQRARAGNLPVKIKRSVKNVDVYNTHAKLIIFMTAGGRGADLPGLALNNREKPIEEALLGEYINKSVNITKTYTNVYIYID